MSDTNTKKNLGIESVRIHVWWYDLCDLGCSTCTSLIEEHLVLGKFDVDGYKFWRNMLIESSKRTLIVVKGKYKESRSKFIGEIVIGDAMFVNVGLSQ